MTIRSHTTRARQPLPDLISLWVARRRLFILGSAIIATAVLCGVWIAVASLPLNDARTTIIEWAGGGAFALLAAMAMVGALLASQRLRRALRRERRHQRSVIAGVLAMIAGWGIAGAFTPDATLGGVALAQHGAGGSIGAWFDAPLGWALIAVLLTAAGGLIAPNASRRAAGATGRALLRGVRRGTASIRRSAPGAVAATGRALWTVMKTVARWLWTGLAWWLREVRSALQVIGGQLAELVRHRRKSKSSIEPPRPLHERVALHARPIDAEAWPPLATEPATESEPPPADDTQMELVLPEPDEPPPERSTLRTLERTAADGWRLPPIDLLDEDSSESLRSNAEAQAQIIVETLASFGVDARVTQINEGPAITQFGVEPGWEIKTRQVPLKDASGAPLLDEHGRPQATREEVSRTRVRVNRITRLADDLALALAAPSIRIEAPVPGQPVVGIEVPNAYRRIVGLRSLIESKEFEERAAEGGLPIALGRDVTGKPVVADLTRMPHVLIAGATGSGKSVCINTIISSLLMQKSPEEVRLILVDPKRVELTGYGTAPHLAFSHVVTEPDEVVAVLGVVVAEMDRRYRRLEDYGARNIVAYNGLPSIERRMPYWVVVLDELADMMMAAASEVEGQLVRLAQLARAVGIHLVVATQRPSVDVVTGLIKANFPTRIAFATTSQTDARVIMDRAGAEKLMGRGDMLFMSSGTIQPRRVQGAFVSDAEIARLLESWSGPSQSVRDVLGDTVLAPTLDEALDELADEAGSATDQIAARRAQTELNQLTETLETALSDEDEPDIVLESEPTESPAAETPQVEFDTRLSEATELARDFERISASLLQRRMRLGRPRAERLIDQLEQTGIVAAAEGGTSRRVLQRSG